MKAANREALAKRVVNGFKAIEMKLKDLEADIRALWSEFEKLPGGQKIMGCTTRKQFCTKVLGRTPRAVRYMLDGGNHKREGRETVSPASDVFDSAHQYLSAFSSEDNLGRLPALLDHLRSSPTLTAEEAKTLKAVLTELEHLSEQAEMYRQQLSEYVGVREAA